MTYPVLPHTYFYSWALVSEAMPGEGRKKQEIFWEERPLNEKTAWQTQNGVVLPKVGCHPRRSGGDIVGLVTLFMFGQVVPCGDRELAEEYGVNDGVLSNKKRVGQH